MANSQCGFDPRGKTGKSLSQARKTSLSSADLPFGTLSCGELGTESKSSSSDNSIDSNFSLRSFEESLISLTLTFLRSSL